MSFWKWSRTASSNASADASINWAEGMAPSAVNDSARAMMAAAAKFRDDTSGSIVTGGTSTAYTLTSFQSFSSLANMSGNMVAFVPHTANGGATTLNVDGLGAKALRSATGVDISAGTLIAASPYLATYNNSSNEWLLHGTYGNLAVPIGCGMDYWGVIAPPTNFLFAYGQAISRTTYAACFAQMGTTYGAGDGSTTFNLPDKRGRASFGKDDMGGVSANRITNQTGGWDGDVAGAAGGAETHALSIAQLAVHGHVAALQSTAGNLASTAGTISGSTGNNSPGLLSRIRNLLSTIAVGSGANGSVTNIWQDDTSGVLTQGDPHTHSVGGTCTLNTGALNLTSGVVTVDPTGSGAAHNNLPPGIVCNYIIRVL